MLFKRYESEGLAHFSYLIADQNEAVLIDPSRDIDEYLDDAYHNGYQITCVFETHRNEDYLIGSSEVMARTGAKVYHADGQWDYAYGQAVEDGQTWQVGRLRIKAIHTPGHTPGSMSYLLFDPDGHPWIVFSGDSLFSGGVGRMDLLGEDRLEEMAKAMYHTLFEVLLPLGDGVIVCPAHGAGSVCGSEIAERTWTTIGLERQLNPYLQANSEAEFIEKFAKMLERPPYFKNMEVLNLQGAPVLGNLPRLKPLSPEAFKKASTDAQLIDTRDQISFGGGFIPNSLCIRESLLANFAGWFLDSEKPILLVSDPNSSETIVRSLIRQGYDRFAGYLYSGIVSWAKAGQAVETLAVLPVPDFCNALKTEPEKIILDVRTEDEIVDGGLTHGLRIPVTHLQENLSAIPKNKPLFIVCPSGNRSILAASLLKNAGWTDLKVLAGGLTAYDAFGCDYEL